MRYAIDWCILGFPDDTNAPSNPCAVSCQPIQNALKANLTQPAANTAYGYCEDGSFMSGVDACTSCNALQHDQNYLVNCEFVLFQRPPLNKMIQRADPGLGSHEGTQNRMSAAASAGCVTRRPRIGLFLDSAIGHWLLRLHLTDFVRPERTHDSSQSRHRPRCSRRGLVARACMGLLVPAETRWEPGSSSHGRPMGRPVHFEPVARLESAQAEQRTDHQSWRLLRAATLAATAESGFRRAASGQQGRFAGRPASET